VSVLQRLSGQRAPACRYRPRPTIVTEDAISITSAGSTPIAWQAGQAQLPFRRHPENTLEPAATAFSFGADDPKAELTQKLMWGDRSTVGQSTPWDAGRDAPTNGQLVDDYG
jgi:hypothetical protein